MKTIPQITRALPKIRIPAWRRASPKKWNTRPLKMSPKASPQKRMMSPSEAIQSRGTPSQPVMALAPTSEYRAGCAGDHSHESRQSRLSSYDQDLGVGRQERLREHVVEGPDPRE